MVPAGSSFGRPAVRRKATAASVVLGLLGLATMGLSLPAQQATTSPVSTRTFKYSDGGDAIYYQFQTGAATAPDTYVFAYGGSGCVSWGPYLPSYFEGLGGGVTVVALNKRHVEDGTPAGACSGAFALDNHPRQWVADYMEFITGQLRQAHPRPRKVVLLGISEGAYVAVKVARSRDDDVTDLAIIGDGGWTMRRSLTALAGQTMVDEAWQAIVSDVNSIEKTWVGHPYRYWFDVMDIDPTPDYLSLSMPIFAGFGEKDQSVPLASALALQESFRQAGKSNFTLRIYEGADHTLVDGRTNYRKSFFEELTRRLER